MMRTRVGAQEVWSSGDVLHFRVTGVIEAAEVGTMLDIALELARVHGRIFFVGDVSAMTGMTAEARQLASRSKAAHQARATIIVGASLPIRALITLVVRAMQILGGAKFSLYFVKTEDEVAPICESVRRRITLS